MGIYFLLIYTDSDPANPAVANVAAIPFVRTNLQNHLLDFAAAVHNAAVVVDLYFAAAEALGREDCALAQVC